MRVSASVELVWQLAAREAVAGEFGEIEPEHFMMALLKFAELPVEQVENIAAGAEAAKDLALEVGTVRERLESLSVETTKARRKLRGRVGRGKSPYEGGVVRFSVQAQRKALSGCMVGL